MTNGYYFSQFNYVNVQCYDAPSDAQVKGTISYQLTNKNANESDFAITNNPTVLGSFLADGLDTNLGKNASSSVSGTPTTTANTVPGVTGAGNDNHAGDSTTTTTAAAQTKSSSASSSSGFVQGGTSGKSGASNIQADNKVLSGSLFAAVVAIVAMCIL